jgi:hypothetical protein
MSNSKEHLLWDKILVALRNQYRDEKPEIIEVLPDRPITFHIKDTDGKLSYYTVKYEIDNSTEVNIDWSTVEQIDPY